MALHGTGGDENSLVDLARMVDQGASILAVRGKVVENGMPRFFRRIAEGVFDLEDLKFRSQELADFVVDASGRYRFSLKDLVAVGYSNGANIASSTLLLRPEVIDKAILLRAMVPFRPQALPDLNGKGVFISAGTRDGLIPAQQTRELASLLESAGASVAVNWVDSDHGLTRAEIEQAKRWLSGSGAD